MPEARLEDFGSGLAPVDQGWFVVNVRDAEWWFSERRGARCAFENEYGDSPVELEQLGINVTVLEPGQAGLYHAEENQEAFLVLSGECALLVEGEERRLRPWDFFHAPPWTEHALVGAGEGPCVILMAGSRSGPGVHYPASGLAARYGASVAEETSDWRRAYAGVEQFRRERPPSWARLPWAVGSEPVALQDVREIGPLARDAVSRFERDFAGELAGAEVHHIGATSLPFGHTKGDVDVNVRVDADAFPRVVTALAERLAVAQRENWTPAFASFSTSAYPLPLGVQVTVIGSADDFLLSLRDRMLADPSLLRRYDEAKVAAASSGSEAYWSAKDALLREILSASQQEDVSSAIEMRPI